MLFLTPDNDFAGKEQVSLYCVRTIDFTILDPVKMICEQHQTLVGLRSCDLFLT